MRAYRYYTCDVFTDTRFGGNPLAVFPDASGLSQQEMQLIAREFNYSETTFVLPPAAEHTRAVRIFTPAKEVPFAGHPNVGTAFVLASAGELGEPAESLTVTFEEEAGVVPVRITREKDGRIACRIEAPQGLQLGLTVEAARIAEAVSLPESAIVTSSHLPQVASVGLPFVIAEVCNREALARARIDLGALRALAETEATADVLLYCPSDDEFDIRARMFAPLDGVPEDPATGSANCALAALLAKLRDDADGEFQWRIAQGVEMGRPSVLEASVTKRDGEITTTRMAGECVLISEGTMYLGEA